jgi:hypothetical protein
LLSVDVTLTALAALKVWVPPVVELTAPPVQVILPPLAW